ncbi:MAG: hypothetical protein MUE84_14315 [Hyphomonas sp.]|nr:hypothetical protein [Hyphomonas sp.]
MALDLSTSRTDGHDHPASENTRVSMPLPAATVLFKRDHDLLDRLLTALDHPDRR